MCRFLWPRLPFFFNAGARPPRLAGAGRMQPLPGLPWGSKGFGGLLEDEASMGQCLHDVGDVLTVVCRESRDAGLEPRSHWELLDQAPSPTPGLCLELHGRPLWGMRGGAVQLHARGPCVPTSLGTLSQVPCSGVG